MLSAKRLFQLTSENVLKAGEPEDFRKVRGLVDLSTSAVQPMERNVNECQAGLSYFPEEWSLFLHKELGGNRFQMVRFWRTAVSSPYDLPTGSLYDTFGQTRRDNTHCLGLITSGSVLHVVVGDECNVLATRLLSSKLYEHRRYGVSVGIESFLCSIVGASGVAFSGSKELLFELLGDDVSFEESGLVTNCVRFMANQDSNDGATSRVVTGRPTVVAAKAGLRMGERLYCEVARTHGSLVATMAQAIVCANTGGSAVCWNFGTATGPILIDMEGSEQVGLVRILRDDMAKEAFRDRASQMKKSVALALRYDIISSEGAIGIPGCSSDGQEALCLEAAASDREVDPRSHRQVILYETERSHGRLLTCAKLTVVGGKLASVKSGKGIEVSGKHAFTSEHPSCVKDIRTARLERVTGSQSSSQPQGDGGLRCISVQIGEARNETFCQDRRADVRVAHSRARCTRGEPAKLEFTSQRSISLAGWHDKEDCND